MKRVIESSERIHDCGLSIDEDLDAYIAIIVHERYDAPSMQRQRPVWQHIPKMDESLDRFQSQAPPDN